MITKLKNQFKQYIGGENPHIIPSFFWSKIILRGVIALIILGVLTYFLFRIPSSQYKSFLYLFFLLSGCLVVFIGLTASMIFQARRGDYFVLKAKCIAIEKIKFKGATKNLLHGSSFNQAMFTKMNNILFELEDGNVVSIKFDRVRKFLIGRDYSLYFNNPNTQTINLEQLPLLLIDYSKTV